MPAPSPAPVHAVLFDHDGTLVDSEATHRELWNQVLQPYGVSLSEDHYRQHFAGVPALANAQDVVRDFALDVAPQALAEAKGAVTRAHLDRQAFPLIPGVVEVLHALRGRGLRLAVVTGAGHYAISATLRWHGLQALFETVVCAEDVVRNKPHPDVYLLALQRLGLPASACVAFEDTEHGLAAAHGAGVPCVAIPTGYSAHHDFSRAAAVRPTMAEAAAWVVQRPA